MLCVFENEKNHFTVMLSAKADNLNLEPSIVYHGGG